jgi:Fe-S cluster assembly protein SufD
MMAGFPNRRDEAWRYSNLKALEQAWPLRVKDAEPSTLIFDKNAEYALLSNDGREHINITVADNVRLTLVQELRGTQAIYARLDIQLGVGATLTHILRQVAGPACAALCETTVTLGAGARYDVTVLNMGSDYSRLTFDANMRGEASHFDLRAVQLGQSTQNIELITRTNHDVAGCTSNQIVRSVLSEKATGTYLGKITVSQDAQKTDARQSAKALLLARTATANIKPELIIHADDVKCAHGATVGEMDAQALFYMAARGISPAEAKVLLTQAFLEDALGETQTEMHAEVCAWLATQFAKVI